MNLKIKHPATELLKLEDERSVNAILSLSMPENIKYEIIYFTKRNALANHDKNVPECCKKCLKAHLMKNVAKLDDKNGHGELISKILPCDAGHDGYYIDQEQLFEI